MNWKQHKLLSVSGIIFLILLLACGFLLFKGRSGYVTQKQALKAKLGELDGLNKRNPFPNSENLKMVEANAGEVKDFYFSFLTTLADDQVVPKQIEPAQFPTLLNSSLRRLRSGARKNKILLPEAFPFGFQTYADGSLPNASHVARLTTQVQIIDAIVQTLYASGATSITEVERDVFDEEKDNVAPVSRRRGGPAPSSTETTRVKESDLYSSEQLTFSFVGSDQSVWNILNAFASHDQFIVVTKVELENATKPNAASVGLFRSADGTRQTSGRDSRMSMDPFATMENAFSTPASQLNDPESAELEAPTGPLLSHEERIIAGRELVTARLTLRVYQFKTDELPVKEPTPEGASS